MRDIATRSRSGLRLRSSVPRESISAASVPHSSPHLRMYQPKLSPVAHTPREKKRWKAPKERQYTELVRETFEMCEGVVRDAESLMAIFEDDPEGGCQVES